MMVTTSGRLVAVLVCALAMLAGIRWESARPGDAARTLAPSPHHTHLAELSTLTLNGAVMTVSIRGWIDTRIGARTPPLLVWLHGGPGASELPTLHGTTSRLERDFLVVHYDQRSAGKSCRYFDWDQQRHTLTILQHVRDAAALIEHLQQRFQNGKVNVVGGSWGSVLALKLAQARPDLIRKVVVRGLLVDGRRNEELSIEFITQRFAARALDPPPTLPHPPYGDDARRLLEQRQVLYQVGGMTYSCYNASKFCSPYGFTAGIAKAMMVAPEISWADILRARSCALHTLNAMWPQIQDFNAFEQVPSLEMPVFVFQGRYDYCTVSSLVPAYVDALDAPFKRLVWFEESGHSPQKEEPLRFQRLVAAAFLNDTFQLGDGDSAL